MSSREFCAEQIRFHNIMHIDGSTVKIGAINNSYELTKTVSTKLTTARTSKRHFNNVIFYYIRQLPFITIKGYIYIYTIVIRRDELIKRILPRDVYFIKTMHFWIIYMHCLVFLHLTLGVWIDYTRYFSIEVINTIPTRR